MGYPALAEGETFYTEGEVSCHRVAVAPVESAHENTVSGEFHQILQRYFFFR